MRTPSIVTIRKELVSLRADARKWWESDNGEYMDVRLQVTGDGDWALHTGDPQYDTDHSGAWGDTSFKVFGAENLENRARELIDGVKDSVCDW